MENSHSPLRWRLLAIVVLAVLSVYSFPYLKTTSVLRSKQAPYSFAPDLSFYLNLSNIGSSHTNPYFANVVLPSGGLGYATFNVVFKVLGFIIKILGNNLWWSAWIWNLLWWTILAIGAIWFFREAFPGHSFFAAVFGLSLLFLFNFGVLKDLVLAWLRLPSLAGFDRLSLPYIRAFFPVIPAALLLLYLAVQVRLARSWRPSDWVWMFVLEATAFTVFPYTAALLAVTTVIAVLANTSRETLLPHAKALVMYGIACGVFDIAFVLLHSTGAGHASTESLIDVRIARVGGLLGGSFWMLAILTATIAVLPGRSQHSKWTMVGLGAANGLILLGDVVFPPALLVSHHGGYFVHTTITLEVFYLVVAAFERHTNKTRLLDAACLAAAALVTASGLLLSFANYRHMLPLNAKTSDLATVLRSLNITRDDLVIARSETANDDCSWVPLFTPAKVLFCTSAQFVMSPEQKRTVYRLRQAFYLYFSGDTSNKITQIARAATDLNGQTRLALVGEIDPKEQTRWEQARASIETDLAPRVQEVETGQAQIPPPHERILVVDSVKAPIFERDRLSQYMSVDSETRIGEFVFLWCKAR